ncbi:ybl167 [Escherichia coli]|nr:ybl167 [Escherichia coli]
MSPAQAKQKQHERYEAVAVQVLRVVPVTSLP